MKAGQLRHKLVIEQPTEVRQLSGGKIKTWPTFATTRGSIEPIAGIEKIDAKEHHAIATHEIKIRWMDGITTKMRIQYDNRFFYIKSVLDKNERRKEIVLMCLEGV